jgi:hypothetical protein
LEIDARGSRAPPAPCRGCRCRPRRAGRRGCCARAPPGAPRRPPRYGGLGLHWRRGRPGAAAPLRRPAPPARERVKRPRAVRRPTAAPRTWPPPSAPAPPPTPRMHHRAGCPPRKAGYGAKAGGGPYGCA